MSGRQVEYLTIMLEKMKTPARWRAPIPFLLCTIILTVSGGCNYFHQDSAVDNQNLLDLLFEPSDMPPHWSAANYGVGKAIDPYRSSDGAGIVFLSDLYPESLGVGEEVYRFRTVARARDDYADELKIIQLASYTPQEWSFISQVVDESYFACSDAPNFTSCTWLARYDRIVIELRSVLIPDRFSLEDMEKIAKIIDEKASKLIEANQ